MKRLFITVLCIISFNQWSNAQTITQTVKGKVTDQITQEGLIGATIILIDSDPLLGVTTDTEGAFILNDVPVGRQNFEIRMIGYESFLVSDVLVNSGKQVILNIGLYEAINELSEVVLIPRRRNEEPLNSMASLSSRQFSVEENQRFAGGLDDPARLVSSFAGVASPTVKSNGISIRGNSPSGLLWRIEGVEVPSPNHFADLDIAGAGVLTALSNQVMGNSDFYTGAFPAEYGNATSGVFDINLRSGNSSEREYSIQAGILGIDFATEGPFSKKNDATYLFNYRYSTLALIAPLLPSDAGILKYQDLSYKIKIPTKKAGVFSFWGVGAYDGINTEALEPEERESEDDGWNSQLSQYLFASGLNNKIKINAKSFLNTTLAFSGNGLTFKEQYISEDLTELQPSETKTNTFKLTLQSQIDSYFSDRHHNRTGFYYNYLGYDLDINSASDMQGTSPSNIATEKGNSTLIQFFSQSKFKLSERMHLNTGFHFQYFGLNNDFSLEPRIALEYKLNEKQSLAFAYGLHSKIESLPIYFINDNGNQPNKNLKFMKANHFVLSYNSMLTESLKLSIEPYYQYLTNVPVEEDGYISTLNIQNNLFFDQALINGGVGRNIGIDFSLEQYLKKGFYYMLSGSFFDSKYTANDGIERNTRFNKNYVFNILLGKEWQVGRAKNNLLSANIRFNYLGGNRIESIDQQASMNEQEVIYGETNGEISFADKFPDTPITSFSISYRKNKPKYSSIWSLQVINSGQTEEFDHNFYNLNTGMVETNFSATVIPNISYKIEF
mgnify:CR=1 FL=1